MLVSILTVPVVFIVSVRVYMCIKTAHKTNHQTVLAKLKSAEPTQLRERQHEHEEHTAQEAHYDGEVGRIIGLKEAGTVTDRHKARGASAAATARVRAGPHVRRSA